MSNSSSSSFIITTDNHKIKDITISIEMPIKDMVEYEIKTIDQLDDWFEYEYNISIEEAKKDHEYYDGELDKYEEMENLLKGELTVLICTCSNDDEGIGRAIYDNFGMDEIVVKNGTIYEEEF